MATYKLIQDIEAEDKILGPLTLRQFIFALIAVFLLYICYILITKHITFMLAIFLPPALFFAFFAFPWGRDQPTETWALAKARYWFKPRRRVWNQSGVKELVTITAPKKIEPVLTNGLSQLEVKSRLKALADTIDSRGWAVKNVNINYANQAMGDSDRLIDIGSVPQTVPADDITDSEDILDETNNPIAQQFESMINQSSRLHRQQLINQLNDIRQQQGPQAAGGGNWFVGQSQPPAPAAPPPAADAQLSNQLAAQASAGQASFSNMRSLRPQPNPKPAKPEPAAPVTPPGDPAILSLAKNNDLNVSTLAREAQKTKDGENQDEVVISLR